MTFDCEQEGVVSADTISSDDMDANLIEMIETVISGMENDQSAMVSRTEDGHLWRFGYGSVEVFVQLTGAMDEDTFIVWSNLLKLPAKNEPQLMRKLLEMNWSQTFEARFGIFNGQIVILSNRTVAELSPSEVSRIITVVATIADEQDDLLQSEFGQ